ncbi:hypothetical protein LINPERHAP2_LOCUS19960 [Linum perenne]
MQSTTTDQLTNLRCPRNPFSEDEVKTFYKPWSKALVVKVLEKLFSFLVVKRRLEFLWARASSIQVSNMTNNFFLVCFSNEGEAPEVVDPLFQLVAVIRIGNYIGRTIRLDLATSKGSRYRYVRVCVEVDLTKPLLGKYMIEDRIFKIEYESLENVCFDCGCYGHKKETCPDLVHKAPFERVEMEATVAVPEVEELDTGEWMMVQQRNRRKPTKTVHLIHNPKVKDSRFSVL